MSVTKMYEAKCDICGYSETFVYRGGYSGVFKKLRRDGWSVGQQAIACSKCIKQTAYLDRFKSDKDV